MLLGPISEQDYMDEYVVGIQNPVQLVSSLALMLKERSYVCLYDTSILSSPEYHIKKTLFDELNRDFLYKWFLFFKGLVSHFNSYQNLIITFEVAEEMNNLVNATLSSIEKRKNQYKSLSPQQKEKFQNVFEQILNNEEILLNLQQKLEKYHQRISNINQPILEQFLDLIKLLNDTLELKKINSRESNDTDERIVARAFYEILVHNHNVAVYTRDDDIRKLISATFKFLISKELSKEFDFSYLKNLLHLNILVLKYNKEKSVFSRFFESSTLPYTGDFRFPRTLSKNKISYVISTTKEILAKIQRELERIQIPCVVEKKEVEEQLPIEKVHRAVADIFKSICLLAKEDDVESCRVKIETLERLTILTKYFAQNDLEREINEAKRKCQHVSLENIITMLKKEQEGLQRQFDQLYSQPNKKMENWQQIQKVADNISENLLKLHFFENAAFFTIEKITTEHYVQFKDLLAKFQRNGFEINDQETPIPQEKISEITQIPIAEIIKIIEKFQINHQRTHAYLTQKNLLLFLFRQ